MRDNTPISPAEVTAIVRRVQALPEQEQRSLLFTLLGRLLVTDPDAARAEVETAEHQRVGL